MENREISKKEIDDLYDRLVSSNRKRGYFLNHDENYAKIIIRGLLFNEKRYGYQSCPCRLAAGVRAEDLDIICPCSYRDADVAEYGSCVCGLYVSKKVYANKEKIKFIPERRPAKEQRIKHMENEIKPLDKLSYPVWRCDVCGYICARDQAPDTCPICGAAEDRFERFI